MQWSVSEPEAEVPGSCLVDSGPAASRGVVTSFERELSDAWEQGKSDLEALRKRADAD